MKKLVYVFFILVLFFLNINNANAFSPVDENCKINFQNQVYILGMKFKNDRTTIYEKEYLSYSWNGKCENGSAVGEGRLRTSALGISVEVKGVIYNGYFIGKVVVEATEGAFSDFVHTYSHNEIWVYEQNVFTDELGFLNKIKELDPQLYVQFSEKYKEKNVKKSVVKDNAFSNIKGEKNCHVNFSDKFVFGDYTLSDIKNKGSYKWNGRCKSGKADGNGLLKISIGNDKHHIYMDLKDGNLIKIDEHLGAKLFFGFFIFCIIMAPFYKGGSSSARSRTSSNATSSRLPTYSSSDYGHPGVDYDKYDNCGNLKQSYINKTGRWKNRE